jgi:amino-acid N-acetyltransferase
LNEVTIRRAAAKDIKAVHRLLSLYGGEGLLLARPLSELYDHLRDFFVVAKAGSDQSVIGACALGICWEDMAEIRSLAVVKGYQGQKFGSQLVLACLEEAKALGIRKVFVLTYVEGFFAKMGFKVVDKSILPHKIWADCLRCSKYPDCDETAMILDL